MANSTLEIWPSGLVGAKQGLLVSTLSSIFFWVVSLLVSRCTPKIAEKQKWRFKNISVSMVHATISGFWSVFCFIEEPQMMEDLIQTHTTMGHTLISVSVGYFLYDTFDMLIYQRTRQTFELLLHHIVIIICFGLAMMTKIYVGYAVLALIVELNSIFLHLRQLLQCCGFQRTNSFYRLNSLINLGTFLGFRILTLAWMTRWLVINRDLVPLVFYSMGSLGLATMTVMNIILFQGTFLGFRILTLAWMTRWLVINRDLVPLVFYSMGSLGLATMTVMNIILFYRLLHSDFLRKKESVKKED